MAPKSPPSKRRASSSNTHPLRSSMAGKRKRESDEGFEVRLVKPGSLQPPNNRPKKKRKGNGAGTAPVCRAFIQLNPFGGSLREVYYNVRSANRWNRMETVDQFTIKGTTFSINQTVFVRPDSSQNTTSAPIESWVAKILEIRVSKPDHAFFRVYWMYRPEDLPGGRQLHHGKSELIASNDMAIIDALTVEKEAAVIYWAEKADESEELEQDGLFWRQTCDVEEGGKLSELSKHCEDEIPWNPDEILVRCESCSKWLHGSCLARKALQEAYESHNVPYPEEDQTTTDEGEAAPPAFTADIGNALSGKIYLTVTDQREENHREYNVAVNCLLCKNTIEGALDEEEKGKEVGKGASEPMQLFENDATSEDTTSASQSEVEPDQSKRDTTLSSTCGQNRTNSGGEDITITVTNQVDPIIPLSALSFKASLGTHIWRQLTDLLTTAQTDVGWLEHIIQFACDVYRFAPHLPHNDNIHLLGILLALHRAEIHIPFEISALSQLAPSNLPLLPLPAINSIHNGPPTTQALARETSARATHPSQELPLSVRPRPPDNQNPLNGQHHPCAPQDVQPDAIERLGIQISTINDALAAQSRDMRRYQETQEHITKKLGDLQSQMDLQNSKIEDTAVIVTGLQRKLEGLSHDVPIDEVQTTRGISADPGVSGNAQDTALALISEMNMKIGSMQNKIQRLEDEGAVLSAHLYQSPQKPSTHTTQHPPRAAPSYKIPSGHPDINSVQPSQKVHLHDLYDRQSVAAIPKTQGADPTQNSRGWVTVNSPAQRAILSSIDEPHYSIRNSTGSPNGLKFTPLEPPVPIPQMAPQTWYSYNSDRQMQTHSHTLSSQAYTISESPHASHPLA